MRKLILLMSLVGVLLASTCYGVVCSNDNLAGIYMILKEEGLSDVAASAIVGNIAQESGGDPACVEVGPKGKGIGIFQLSNDYNRQTLVDYCAGPEHANHPKVTLTPGSGDTSYTVCNRVRCQVLATLPGIKSTLNNRSWSGFYNSQVQSLEVLNSGVVSGQLPASVSVSNSWKGFCNQKDLQTAVLQFMCDYETPGVSKCLWVGLDSYSDDPEVQQGFISSFTYRYSAARRAYNNYRGKDIVFEESVEEVIIEEPVFEPVFASEPPVVETNIIQEKVIDPVSALDEDVIVNTVSLYSVGVAMLDRFGSMVGLQAVNLEPVIEESTHLDNRPVQFIFTVVGTIMIVFSMAMYWQYCRYKAVSVEDYEMSVSTPMRRKLLVSCFVSCVVGLMLILFHRG